MTSSFAIGLTQEENNLLAGEILLLETSFSAVEIFDCVALFEAALERLEHDCVDLPILITTNTVRDFGVLDTDVRDYLDGFVVTL